MNSLLRTSPSGSPHAGRGGWSCYTGSAAWMYRFVLESLLGLQVEAGQLRFAPCVPQEWTSFKVHFCHRQTRDHVTVVQSPEGNGAPRLTVDGVAQRGQTIALVDDGREYVIELALLESRSERAGTRNPSVATKGKA